MNHFWINEGMNTFMERKILGSYYGEEFAKIDYFTGNTSMYFDDMVDYYGLNNSYSSLYPDVKDDDPENAFSGVPYEKGGQFMYYIESFLGEIAMQAMLRAYIRHFSQQAIDQEDFQQWYYGWLNETFPNNSTKLIEMTMWDVWIFEPGLGPVQIDVATTALDEAEALALEYLELNASASPSMFLDFNDFFSSQKVAFIQKLATSEGVTANLAAYIDNDLALIESRDPSVKTEWYILGIKIGYDAVLDPAYVWLGEQGRYAYCTSIYRALIDNDHCDLATEWFRDYNATYNSYVVHSATKALTEGCGDKGESLSSESSTNQEGESEASGQEANTIEEGKGEGKKEATSSAFDCSWGGALVVSFTLIFMN
jgi:leukotriene-A4 hydrolase